MLSSGAGSEMRHAMGVAVFFGMLGVTLFGLFLTPVFYVLLRSIGGKKLHSAPHEAPVCVPHRPARAARLAARRLIRPSNQDRAKPARPSSGRDAPSRE